MDEKASILIVDDDESIRSSLALIFGKKGYETGVAGTGREATERAQERFFNVALVDIKLPDMEGVDLLKSLKQMRPDMGMIMITGFASAENAVEALNKGASAYITKPLNMDEVLASVREILEKQRLVRENRRLYQETQRELAERKRTDEQLRRRLKELSALHDISILASSSFNLEEILAGGFGKILEVLEAETGSLMTLDEKGEFLTIRACQGLKKEVASQIRVRRGEEICGWVTETGQPLLLKNGVSDISDPRFKGVVENPSIRHAICAPLKYKDRVLGVINLNRESSLEPYNEEDLQLLSTIASEVAAAIQNINLYDELRDTITKLQQANREIKEAESQLIQSEKLASLGRLAAGVAHELNNPLAIASGRAELLLMDDDKDPTTTKGLTIIREQTARASKVVGNLLQFSRQRKEEVEPIDINAVIEKTAFLIAHQISLENIELSMELKPDLPKIMANFNQLQQVFINLMTNAWQAMPEGGKLAISTNLCQECLVIKFTDTGCGIRGEHLNKLFEPFFTTKDTGTGLGLSIIHGIIEDHQGTIEVESQVGRGTAFTVRIPVIEKGQLRNRLQGRNHRGRRVF